MHILRNSTIFALGSCNCVSQVTAQAFEEVKLQVASSIQHYTILQEQLRRLEHDNKRVKDLLEAEKRDSALMAGQNQKLLKDIQTADSEVAQYREQRDSLMLEISSHKTTIVTYDGRFTDLQRQINMLHGALQAERKDNDQMRSLLQDSREQVIKIGTPSFSKNSSDSDDSKERQAIKSLHSRLMEKEEECFSLKKLLESHNAGSETARADAVASRDSGSLQFEINDMKKIIARVQAENEILKLQLQAAQAQLRQHEHAIGVNSSSTVDVVSARAHSDYGANSTTVVSSNDVHSKNVASEQPASGSRPSSGSISDGISEIGSFFGSFASRVQSSVAHAATSVSTVASSVTSATGSFTTTAFSNTSAAAVSSSSSSSSSSTAAAVSSSSITSSSTHKTSSSLTVESVSVLKENAHVSRTLISQPSASTFIVDVQNQLPPSSQSITVSTEAPAAPSVVGTGLFITSSKTQESPVRFAVVSGTEWPRSCLLACAVAQGCAAHRYQHLIQSILKGSPASFVDTIQPNDVLVSMFMLLFLHGAAHSLLPAASG